MRIGVHEVLFKTTIAGQGDDQQREQYLDEADNYRIFGCFAMTELGHRFVPWFCSIVLERYRKRLRQ